MPFLSRASSMTQDLVVQAQRTSRNMLADRTFEARPGAAVWIPNTHAGEDALRYPAVAKGEPVALYSVDGHTQWRGIGPKRHEVISVPVTVGEKHRTLFAPPHNPTSEQIDAVVEGAARAMSGHEGPEAFGVFLTTTASRTTEAELRKLSIVTDIGSMPLRVDGPSQVLTGARQLVLGKGMPDPNFYIEGAHPSLVGIVDRMGSTRGFHLEPILAIHA